MLTADGTVPFHSPRMPSAATTLRSTCQALLCRLPRDCMRTFTNSSGLHTVAAMALRAHAYCVALLILTARDMSWCCSLGTR